MKKLTTLILISLMTVSVWGQTYDKITLTGAYSQIRFEPSGQSNYYLGTKAQDGLALGLWGGTEKSWLTYWKEGTGDMIIQKGNVGIGTTTPTAKLDVAGLVKSTELNVVKSTSPYLWVKNTTKNASAESVIKASYSYDGSSQQRSARLELGTVHKKGEGHYNGKVWSVESFSSNTWANAPVFRINRGSEKMLSIDYYGNIGIGISPSSGAKLKVAGNIKAQEIEVTLASIDDMQLNGTLAANQITVTTNGQTADFVFEDDYELRDLQEVESFIKTNKHLPDIPSAAAMEENGVNLAEMNKLLLLKIEELTLYMLQQQKEINELKHFKNEMESENNSSKK